MPIIFQALEGFSQSREVAKGNFNALRLRGFARGNPESVFPTLGRKVSNVWKTRRAWRLGG